MTIRVPMPDGTVAEFPEGTKPEVIERVRQQKARAAAHAPVNRLEPPPMFSASLLL